ncbi:MAG: class II aldolase/adducin family protein [Acidobacteriota bacterium]
MAIRDDVSEQEWQTRVDLAACYRLVDHYGMSDLVGTHISARVPGEESAFLINPYGWYFDEITASSLVKVDLDGRILSEVESPINPAGFVIHSAVLGARPDVACVLHTHTRAGMAVSAMECGLLSITQHSMKFHNRLSYHEYEGVATNLDERERLVRDLGDNHAMILRNHGLLTAGRSVSEAFFLMFRLEKCCQAQVDAMAGGTKLHMISPEVSESTSRMMEDRGTRTSDLAWPGQIRRLDKLDPSYKQ